MLNYKNNHGAMVIVIASILSVCAGIYSNEQVYLHCHPDSMKLKFVSIYPFYGRIYVYNSTGLCEIYGSGNTAVELTLPLNSGCNVIEESPDVFNVIVVIQHHPLVQKKGDRRLKLNCDYRIINQTVSSAFNSIVDNVHDGSVVNSTAPSPKVRFRVLDRRGADVMDTKLGQELFLRVDMDTNSIFALAPRSLIASSGSTSEQIELLDNMGCPVDNVIFSGLDNLGDSRFLQGRFQAFKFANDLIVRFHLNVQFCVQKCPPVQCIHQESNSILGNRKRRHNYNWGTTGTTSTSSELLLPLQREIIVESATVNSIPYPASSSSTIVGTTDDDFICLSKSWFIVILLCLILLQICILITSVICIWVGRSKKVTSNTNETGDPEEKIRDTDSVTSFAARSDTTLMLIDANVGSTGTRSRSTFYTDGLNTRL